MVIVNSTRCKFGRHSWNGSIADFGGQRQSVLRILFHEYSGGAAEIFPPSQNIHPKFDAPSTFVNRFDGKSAPAGIGETAFPFPNFGQITATAARAKAERGDFPEMSSDNGNARVSLLTEKQKNDRRPIDAKPRRRTVAFGLGGSIGYRFYPRAVRALLLRSWKMTKTRFVLFSAARSGTSFMKETLGSHPEVQTYGEIFHDAPEAHLPPELRTEEQLRSRKDSPIEFAYRVLDSKPEKAAVGFKMWLDQCPEAGEALLQDGAIKKIILARPNKLATYTSGLAARTSGIWNVQTRGENNYKPPLLSFEEKYFDGHVRHHERLYSSYRSTSVGEVLELTYSELVENGFEKITSFLGVTNITLTPRTYRLLSDQILERFEPEVRPRVVAHLQKIGKTEWLDPE